MGQYEKAEPFFLECFRCRQAFAGKRCTPPARTGIENYLNLFSESAKTRYSSFAPKFSKRKKLIPVRLRQQPCSTKASVLNRQSSRGKQLASTDEAIYQEKFLDRLKSYHTKNIQRVRQTHRRTPKRQPNWKKKPMPWKKNSSAR